MWGSDVACIQDKCSLITTVILERKIREMKALLEPRKKSQARKRLAPARETETPRKTKSTLSLYLNFRVSIHSQ